MLEREEARRLLQERSESWPWATDVTRVTRTAADGGEPTPLDDLGFRIVEIVAHQNAAEYELLTLLAEFDRRQGWAASHSSCVEWLIHHTGESAVACRERLRVAHALPDLPRTRAAMARGELGYTKVKELTRLATPENETALVELARHATVRQLKTTLSGYKIHSRKGEEALARWQQEQRRLSVSTPR